MQNILNPTEKQAMQQLLKQLNASNLKNSRFTILKYRYFQLCELTPIVEEMMRYKLPIRPRSILTFSRNRNYPIQNQKLSNYQQVLVNQFLKYWKIIH